MDNLKMKKCRLSEILKITPFAILQLNDARLL